MHHIGDLLQPGVSAMDVLIEAGPAGILKVSEPRVCQLHTEAIGQLRKLLPDA
jgi:predicted transcriptional regulator